MLFEELGKIKRSSIMTSIIMATLGIVMIMCPERYVGSFISVLGNGLIVYAIVKILTFLTARKSLINYLHLVDALILLLLGIGVLVFDNIVLIIGIAFGLLLVLLGIIGIFNAWMYARRAGRKGWWVLVLLNFLTVVFGAIILVNPWWNEPVKLFDIIGGVLLFSSVVSIVRLIIVWPIKTEKED